jgi:hypothetical protein
MSLLSTLGHATGLWGGAAGEDPYKKYEAMYAGIKPPTNEDIQSLYQQQAPQGRAAQMTALQGYQDIAAGGGLTAADVARNQEMLAQTQGAEAAGRRATLSSMAARGMAGGGSEMAANLAGQQAMSEANALRGAGTAALGQQARMQALGGMAGLGQGIRAGDIEQAQAADAIRNFNFMNQMARAQGMSGAYPGQAAAQAGQAQQAGTFLGNLIGGGADIGASMMGVKKKPAV